MSSQYASIDGCVRSYARYSNDIEEVIGKCMGIAEDLNELEGQDRELAALRANLISIVETDIMLKQMSDATRSCKTAMRDFYESNSAVEDAVPNLANLYENKLRSLSSRSSSSNDAESHQAVKEFDSIQKPQSRANQVSEEIQQEPDSSGVIFSQVEEALYCPITKKYFEEPVRNKLCNHCYSKAAVCEMLARKQSIKCPVGGCTKQVMMPNLVADKELARKVKRKMKQDKFDKQHTADSAVQL